MIITALVENTAAGDYLTEHGLSLYVETGNRKILFDTGQSDFFLRNAKKLEVDLSKVDFVVISHGHYDHGGGIKNFLSINNEAIVYINEYALEPHYSLSGKNIGIDPDLKDHRQVILTTDHHDISPELEIFTGNKNARPFRSESSGLVVMRGGEMVPEDFIHEQYLLIKEEDKKTLITGCSHKGILNIMHWMKDSPPDVVIGGFHLMHSDFSQESRNELDDLASALAEYKTVYYTCHCTGVSQYEYLKTRMNESLHYISTGQELKF